MFRENEKLIKSEERHTNLCLCLYISPTTTFRSYFNPIFFFKVTHAKREEKVGHEKKGEVTEASKFGEAAREAGQAAVRDEREAAHVQVLQQQREGRQQLQRRVRQAVTEGHVEVS